jgi:hypothetical protein
VRDFVKRTLHRLHAQTGVGENFFPKPPGGFTDLYNDKTEDAIKVVQLMWDIKPTGQMGTATFEILWDYADDYSKWVYSNWTAPQPKPELVEPDQGFHSLHISLWPAYSLCRTSGLTDLGTYNPASKLPSGAPSDHAVYPALAFDCGIDPDTGWQNLKARAVALLVVKDPAVEYVILGNRIWTDWRKAWGAYYGGGHMNHLHVSGHR